MVFLAGYAASIASPATVSTANPPCRSRPTPAAHRESQTAPALDLLVAGAAFIRSSRHLDPPPPLAPLDVRASAHPQHLHRRVPSRRRDRGRRRPPPSQSQSSSASASSQSQQSLVPAPQQQQPQSPTATNARLGGGGGAKEERSTEQLRLDLNLEADVQIKAKVHGDVTLSLMA